MLKKYSATSEVIWIDLENSPNVPFFKPIVHELEQRRFPVVITTRDAYQTKELADFHKLNHTCIGKHAGKNKILKLYVLLSRAIKLTLYIWKFKPTLAISHGSRSQLIASKLLNIKSVVIFDYEYTTLIPFLDFTFKIIPSVLGESIHVNGKNPTFKYNGIKEDVYVPIFKPQNKLCKQLNYPEDKIIVTIRPPATEAHYHVYESEHLFLESVEFLKSKEELVLIILPRSHKQRDFIKQKWSEAIKQSRIIIPETVFDGLELIWNSDLVISGGGTMNREAAALGVPVYSIFRGKIGAVDQFLEKQGRLILIENKKDLSDKIRLAKRVIPDINLKSSNLALNQIVDHLVMLIKKR